MTMDTYATVTSSKFIQVAVPRDLPFLQLLLVPLAPPPLLLAPPPPLPAAPPTLPPPPPNFAPHLPPPPNVAPYH